MNTPFRLATLSAGGCHPFGAIVVGEQAMALKGLEGYLNREGLDLHCDGSTLSILEDWEHNEPILQRVADALAIGTDRLLMDRAIGISHLKLHAPVAAPNVYCSGANYFKHVVDIIVAQKSDETAGMNEQQRREFGIKKMTDRKNNGTPFFFVKANSTIVGPHDEVSLPPDVSTMDWELELGVVIGRRARFVNRADALNYVAGYMVVNDLTIRERVNRKDAKEMGMDWVAAKCAPTALPTGPYLVPARYVGDPQRLHLTLRHNGTTMQDGGTDDMIFDCARLIESLSKLLVLQPGDLICTGSPAGNGIHHGVLLKAEDVIEGTITGPLESLGMQRNRCVPEVLQH